MALLPIIRAENSTKRVRPVRKRERERERERESHFMVHSNSDI